MQVTAAPAVRETPGDRIVEVSIPRSQNRLAHVAAAVLLGLSGLLLHACSKLGVHGVALENQRPTVELSQVPVPGDTAGTYVYELSWAAFDADGRITRFQYAVDPPA